MSEDASDFMAALLLSAALIWTLVGCLGPDPSPMIEPPMCDEEAAHVRAVETCAAWSDAIDLRPDYCTKSGTVVDGFPWCVSEGSE